MLSLNKLFLRVIKKRYLLF